MIQTPFVSDDIDPTSKWVEVTHMVEFDPNIDDLEWMGLDDDPLVAPGMVDTSRATTSTIIDVPIESDKFEPQDGLVANVEDPIFNSGDEFDD
jgi:hypothetical protein